MTRARARAGVLLFALLIPGARAIGEEAEDPSAPGDAAPSPSAPAVVGRALLEEAKRYARDGAALVTSPLRWNDRDWTMFSAFAVSFGILLATDGPTYAAIQDRRSPTTNDISKVTTPFGHEYAWAAAGAMLAGGLITNERELRDTGRVALEAAVFASIITAVLKPAFGRERPEQSDGRTVFHGFTSQYESLPSGHATMAWAVASVVAMRTDGWIVPTVAYTLATLVAFDRVNDQKHFVSDVFMGAAIGVAVGRFVVGRHPTAGPDPSSPAVRVALVPIPGGIGARLAF